MVFIIAMCIYPRLQDMKLAIFRTFYAIFNETHSENLNLYSTNFK